MRHPRGGSCSVCITKLLAFCVVVVTNVVLKVAFCATLLLGAQEAFALALTHEQTLMCAVVMALTAQVMMRATVIVARMGLP